MRSALPDPTAGKVAPVRRLLDYLEPHLPMITLGVLLMLASTVASVMIGLGLRVVIDAAVMHLNDITQRLAQAVPIASAVIIAFGVAVFGRGYCMQWVAVRVTQDVRRDIFSGIIDPGPGDVDSIAAGDLQTRIIADTQFLGEFLSTQVPIMVTAALMVIGGLVGALYVSPDMTAAVAVSVPVILLPFLLFKRKLRVAAEIRQNAIAELGRYAGEVFRNIRLVQAYGQQSAEGSRFTQRAGIVSRRSLQVAAIQFGVGAAGLTFALLGFAGLLWFAARRIAAQQMTIGEVVAFAFFTNLIVNASGQLTGFVTALNIATGTARRILQYLGAAAPETAAQPAPVASSCTGRIEFRDVHFAYPNRRAAPILKGFNLTIEAGSRVVIVGASGVGKSTLFELLMRFHDPQEGRILLDGIPLCSIPLDELRSRFALVSQRDELMSGTVRENIRYGAPEASDEQAVVAARIAHADELICGLPNGYETRVGETGRALSGGERQRVALARAVLVDRPVLLLDEATSALDLNSEAAIDSALQQLCDRDGITTVLISHRWSIVSGAAARVIVVGDGRVIAEGPHERLLAECALYRRLLNAGDPVSLPQHDDTRKQAAEIT